MVSVGNSLMTLKAVSVCFVLAVALASGCTETTLERASVDDAWFESVSGITESLGQRDHRVDGAFDWHHHDGIDGDLGCTEHRYARWVLTSLEDVEVAFDGFAAEANAVGFSIARVSDSADRVGVLVSAYHYAGEGLGNGYEFGGHALDAEAVADWNSSFDAISDMDLDHPLPEDGGGWVELSLHDMTECTGP